MVYSAASTLAIALFTRT
ncbi:hypothetical protein [Intestinirhabdus alba]